MSAFNGYPESNLAISSISIKDFLARKWSAWKRPVLITSLSVEDKNPHIVSEYLQDRPWAAKIGIRPQESVYFAGKNKRKICHFSSCLAEYSY